MSTNKGLPEKIKSVISLITISAENLEPLIRQIVLDELSKIQAQPKESIKEKSFSVAQSVIESGLSDKTIRRRINSGDLKHSRVGKKGKLIRIKESDLQALLVEQDLKGRRYKI